MRAVCGLCLAAMSVAAVAIVQLGLAAAPVLRERAPQSSGARVEGRDSAIEALATASRAAPPEFAADVLLRLSESSRIVDPEWRRELLEEAYLRAYASSEAYRVTAVATPTDSRQGAQVAASDTALTRVSLQVRVAQMMVSIDAARAREMFEWIDLDLAPGTCDSPLVPAVDEYYTTLAFIARNTYPNDTTGRGDALRFLNLFLWRAHLPSEMPAVAVALRRFRPTIDEALFLESTFRWILESSARDPRSFSSRSLDLVTELMALEDADRRLGITNWNVTRALRDYLTAQFKGARCSDSLSSDGPTADSFNAALKRRDVMPELIAPLAAGDTRPSRLLGIARIERYWRTPDARRLYEAGARLRGPDKSPVPIRVRLTEAWLTQAERLLTDLEQWTGSREALERDYLYQKAVLYTLLIDLVPQSALRTRMLRSYLEFLKHADRDRSSRTLWFAFADRLIELTHTADRRLVLNLLEESNHPVLSLYGRVDRLLGFEKVKSEK